METAYADTNLSKEDSPDTAKPEQDLFKVVPSDWDKICTLLMKKLGHDNYTRCFSGTTARIANNRVVLHVPNPIHQLWIESNFSGTVTDAVAEVLGAAGSIEYEVSSEVLRPLSIDASVEKKAARVISTRHHDDRPAASPHVTDESLSIRSFSDAGLNAKFNFDSFVVGSNSSYSAAVARAVAEKPGRIYNPLFFYGATGLGKTHLMQAIGQEVLARKKKAIVRYVTSEQFTNEYVEAIKKQSFTQFRQKYRKVDVLLIDDVQFFEGKDSTQEEFFHTFNELFNNAKQIVLASDRAPSDIKNLEARLVSRFEWGLTTQIQTPDFETRVAILRRKMHDFNVSLEPWILEFIAQRIRANVRKLEGALMRVASYKSLSDREITRDVIENLLRDIFQEQAKKAVTIDQIQRCVAEHFDVRIADMSSKRRPANIALARQYAMYLSRQHTSMPLTDIGDAFGGRDHGTVIHACKLIKQRMVEDEKTRQIVSLLDSKLQR
jgi:chromosomal replication initiator protein